ncbi:MAG: hypothetical protein IKT00_14380 [Prevotella sp.]|nr:hypothetical protein [Prevotella sp.]
MKKILFILTLFCANFCMAQNMNIPPTAVPIMLQIHWDEPGGMDPEKPRSPIPEIYYDDHTIYFEDTSHVAYTLKLVYAGVVVWQTSVEATATSVDLPASLSGNYQIRLSYSPDFYFYSGITL